MKLKTVFMFVIMIQSFSMYSGDKKELKSGSTSETSSGISVSEGNTSANIHKGKSKIPVSIPSVSDYLDCKDKITPHFLMKSEVLSLITPEKILEHKFIQMIPTEEIEESLDNTALIVMSCGIQGKIKKSLDEVLEAKGSDLRCGLIWPPNLKIVYDCVKLFEQDKIDSIFDKNKNPTKHFDKAKEIIFDYAYYVMYQNFQNILKQNLTSRNPQVTLKDRVDSGMLKLSKSPF